MKFRVNGLVTVSCFTLVSPSEAPKDAALKVASERILADLHHHPFGEDLSESFHFDNDGEPEGLTVEEELRGGNAVVSGLVTVSCWTDVEAQDAAAALSIAAGRELSELCDRPFSADAHESFHFEADGTPFRLAVATTTTVEEE